MSDIIKNGYDGIYHRSHGYYKGGFKEKQEKAMCVPRSGWLSSFFVHQHGKRREFTADECEELQTLPHHYTYDAGSDSARVSLIGNAWTVVVIRDLPIWIVSRTQKVFCKECENGHRYNKTYT